MNDIVDVNISVKSNLDEVQKELEDFKMKIEDVLEQAEKLKDMKIHIGIIQDEPVVFSWVRWIKNKILK